MSESDRGIEHGFLVLADISGYTAFISRTELLHAQEILSDLLETVVVRFESLLTIHKIEGDAVFGYCRDAQAVRGETLLELIESTYVAFRDRTKNVRRHTGCNCRACQSIPMLDLKFIVHHGDFALQNIGGRPELAGSDVNLVHRLLKNHVGEKTGWSAYALFTRAGLDQIGLDLPGVVSASESYEHLGEVEICALDLHARYEALMEQRHIVVEESEAYVTFSQEIRATPAVIWSWLNDPRKRALLSPEAGKLRFVPMLRPNGRTGIGATTHCVHGKDTAMRETVLDWKPFEYYTVEQDSGPLGKIQATFRLEPLEAGLTRLRCTLRGRMPGFPGFMQRGLIRFGYTRVFNYASVVTRLRQMLEQPGAEAQAASAERTAAEESLAA